MADTFKIGDVVALKSGGVAMTVVETWECDKQGWAIVAWDVSGTVSRETFPIEALEYEKRVVATYDLSPEQIFDVVEDKFIPVNADNLRHNRN
jgi:uncharacterized protein YodC (DUF2158 family)